MTHVVEIGHQLGSYFKNPDFLLNPIGKKAPQAAQKFETLLIFENSLQQEFWKNVFENILGNLKLLSMSSFARLSRFLMLVLDTSSFQSSYKLCRQRAPLRNQTALSRPLSAN